MKDRLVHLRMLQMKGKKVVNNMVSSQISRGDVKRRKVEACNREGCLQINVMKDWELMGGGDRKRRGSLINLKHQGGMGT